MFFVLLALLMRVRTVELCTHADAELLPATSDHSEVELSLDCSYENITVTAGFALSSSFRYTILFTCTYNNSTIYNGTFITGAISNLTKSIPNPNISCNSLCSFGGCYTKGPLGNVVTLAISPLQSCYMCREGNDK